jgi:UDP-glucuronate 4-epimerase
MDTELEKEFIEGQRGDVEVTFANTKKLQELVDYNPQINLSQGVAKFINWYKKYYNLP